MNYMSEMARTNVYDIRALVAYDEEFLELARQWGPMVYHGADTKFTNVRLGVAGTKSAMAARDSFRTRGNQNRGRGGVTYRGGYSRGGGRGYGGVADHKPLTGWRKVAADKGVCFKFSQAMACEGCQFKHQCINCDNPNHSMGDCPQGGDKRA